MAVVSRWVRIVAITTGSGSSVFQFPNQIQLIASVLIHILDVLTRAQLLFVFCLSIINCELTWLQKLLIDCVAGLLWFQLFSCETHLVDLTSFPHIVSPLIIFPQRSDITLEPLLWPVEKWLGNIGERGVISSVQTAEWTWPQWVQ